ncbi:MAG: DNA alkylation repair protein [Clostridia bacterium]|nr:DNA alkylation repair protein [Clostridia bacterium]
MELKIENWNNKIYEKYLDYLKEISSEKTKSFNERIMNDTKQLLGITIPTLRKIAKEILKGNAVAFLKVAKNHDKYVEEVMIESFVIALVKENFSLKIERIDKFIPKISSWGICDSFVPSLKCINKNKDEFWKYLMNKYENASEEFELRFIIICLMDYYIEDEKLDKLFEIFYLVKKDEYYVQMAVAWAICECYIKKREKTLEYLQNKREEFDMFTYNKAIDKCRDSYRVSDKDKEILNRLKK